ncbi:DUF6489 family protein [Salinimonas iocasae]|uniref:Uncharacterized protein n=1 Tax=Salinimonas iocasae TaxID=2572577 RepID=A0A5B7YHE7_9ALTE|nr:DUF6489 family protein [Salinimonas iocasae]QCZ94836.1 hypothetical protein FBQ74_15775 [Salinimonas iocasae]|tara:strand:+ start:540 stop:776 length:237 start_codon:yes stop_codon:yes gene_type:complete
MKISIDVDISPQEARELFGWPDLSQLHETTLSALNEQLANGNHEALMAMLKPYLASSQNAFSMYQKFFENMATQSQKK